MSWTPCLRLLTLLMAPLLLSWACLADDVGEPDTDGDGLSDFHERYKYLTDPERADSDGDGIGDGDWLERREYQYVIRSVVQVMKPVTGEYLTDDYQDARVLDETDQFVELEVIHYPFNQVAESIRADEDWRRTIRREELGLEPWLAPGPTSDWTHELRAEIFAELSIDGIDAQQLNDRELAEQVSSWLLRRAPSNDGFSTFATAFDSQGRPYIPEDLRPHVGRESALTPEQQWEREISAAGMFRNKTRGSCSSSSIYLSGCLRAVGLPARTILCIPVVDAGDEEEMAMVSRLQQPAVRTRLTRALEPLKNSWASHTYNEVFVGGRWRRLNYNKLGQNIYDPNLFGLMTHVATFRDWADARMHATIGRRQTLGGNDQFGGNNPYSTISLRDQVGEHCALEFPELGPRKLVRPTDSLDG